MRLSNAHVTKYRSVRDSEPFEVESLKTIMVGPNEAGKTAVLEALQQLNAPQGVRQFEALRDYPRSEFNDITTNKVDPAQVTVVEGHFSLEPDDLEVIPSEFHEATFVVGRRLDNSSWYKLEGGRAEVTFGDIEKDLTRLAAHADSRVPAVPQGTAAPTAPSTELESITNNWTGVTPVNEAKGAALQAWLKAVLPLVDEHSKDEEARYDRLKLAASLAARKAAAIAELAKRIPVFVRFSNYFSVRPLIHLGHLAKRLSSGILDDEHYDYGNKCLLDLLGFTAQELSDLGKAPEPAAGDAAALKRYRDQLDHRAYQLNAASVRLSEEIRKVWVPDAKKDEADRLRVVVDQQYLKVVVEDELGVEIELDQRSQGFQWLVSFFIVFFAETAGKHKNAILLLDEPGLSLHGLKQREFRTTISRLSELNQTLYTTHSPFLVGPDELDFVRVVEMTDRRVGTKVHTQVTAADPAALLPLQEALGYDLAQSLFAQQRNLVLEGLTDYWYVEAVGELLRDAGVVDLSDKIALVPAASAGKVVYYATILHAQKLKVAALLDADSAGDQAAKQEVLVHTLGNRAIIRTRDAYVGGVKTPEIEDLLRTTLVGVAKSDLGWDVEKKANAQTERPIVDLFVAEIAGFSKYKLAKAFLRWARAKEAKDLTVDERKQWTTLIGNINAALK